ncbi:hypothetical protein [Escherichia coli]|uniref:hypothetical protein n=1 Tax=Escherichia coli TaxID=562 RepID=UPI000BDFAAC2|nr:hypothetical protein [Escherichia coli]PCS38710.1 hypothetical protein BMR38_25400 [Escherichia coli]PHL32598.1 hypothetical protein BMR39_02255 [Escherichia coli]
MSKQNTMPSLLNMVTCKSPFEVPFSAQCYQGVTSLEDFTYFLGDVGDSLHELNVREHDRYGRLIRAYYHNHAIIHALIDIRAGIVKTISYSVQIEKIDTLRAEFFIYQIRQHFDRF